MRQAVQEPVFDRLSAAEAIVGVLLQHSTDEAQIMARVAEILVRELQFGGAAVVLAGDDGNLFLRAFALDDALAEAAPALAASLQNHRDSGAPFMQMGDARRASSALHRALSGSQVVVAAPLCDLFCPLLDEPDALPQAAQEQWPGAAAISLRPPGEVDGCLLVVSTTPQLPLLEQRVLQVIAQQLALGLRNARLYWRVEEQRRVAQTFAQMAFSSSAYLHTMRNQIGALRTYLGLVNMLPRMTPEQRAEVIGTGEKARKSLDQVAEILDHLHEPWRPQVNSATAVNDCIIAALVKLFRGLTPQQREQRYVTSRGMQVQWRLADGLPPLQTAPDMLLEAFHIVLRNAVDSLHEKYGFKELHGGLLTIESGLSPEGQIAVTISDNGVGIAPADRQRIFDLGWSTKRGEGMGFGLFWARNYVEGLGGRLFVESRPAAGAAFRFLLPGAHGEPGERHS